MACFSEELSMKTKRLLVCNAQAVAVLVCLVPLSTAITPEGLALLDFRNQVQDPVGVLGNWNISDLTPCSWRGVICNNVTNRVEALVLPRAFLSGTISSQLGTVSVLRRLELHFNKFTGPIPASLGNLTYLQALYLNNNSLTGTLPDTLALLSNLQVLDISNNKLQGEVPESYTNLSKRRFVFTGNGLLCGDAILGLPKCQLQSVDPSPTLNISRTWWSLWKILLVSVGAFLVFKLIIGLVLLRRWQQKDKQCEINLGKGGKLVMFKGGSTAPTSKEMLRALRRVKKKDIVGEGGYGTVYKIVLKDNCTFAVKKLKQCLEAARGFENELETLGEIKHCNLVKLRGYCISPSSKLLVYDFLPNGTLDQLLHPRTEAEKLNPVAWQTRISIALGVSRALAYLHHCCEPRIVHRDVSATNVLLEENFEPRLSDFGLAKLMDNGDTHVSVTVAGTFGYISPEYAKTGQASEKSDVYSFGVLVLEILSRRRPTESSISDDHANLAGWVRSLHEKSEEFEIVEKWLRDTVPHRELAVVMEIACKCISMTPQERPRMDKIAQYLERLVEPDSGLSDFTYSTNPSTRTRSLNTAGMSGRDSHGFLDISDLPGFRHDGHKFIIDLGQSS